MASLSGNATTKHTHLDDYIHTFGYEFAKKLLGEESVEDLVQNCYHEINQQQSMDEETEEPSNNMQIHGFRANWRSDVRFSWHLPRILDTDDRSTAMMDGSCRVQKNGSGEKIAMEAISPETLFVDVTFDFLLFPYNSRMSDKGVNCHVLSMDDLNSGGGAKNKVPVGRSRWNNDGEFEDEEDTNVLGVSVAIRIGALLATPNCSKECNDHIDNYEFHYLQGDQLAASDIHQHCREVDVDPEFSDASHIAALIANAFLEGCYTNKDYKTSSSSIQSVKKKWHISAVRDDKVESESTGRTIDFAPEETDQTTNELFWRWDLKLHHKTLEMDGSLEFHRQRITFNDASSTEEIGVRDAIRFGEPIGRRTLDMMLLQNNRQSRSASVVGIDSIPADAARKVWKQLDPALLQGLEDSSETAEGEMMMSLTSSQVGATPYSQSISANSNEQSSPPPRSKPGGGRTSRVGQWSPPKPPRGDSGGQQKPSNKNNNLKRSNPSQRASSSSRNQPEPAVFARGKKTSILGSKRRKKKLTLGDI